MQPVSAFHTSGTRPVWRNDASNLVGAALSSATKYQSAGGTGSVPSEAATERGPPVLCIHDTSGCSQMKSGAMPSSAMASAAFFAITPFVHTESTRAW